MVIMIYKHNNELIPVAELHLRWAGNYGAPFVKVFRTDYSEPRLAGGGVI